MAKKNSVFRLILLLVSIVYFYLLVKIILFKFGTPNPPFLMEQLRRAIEDPERLKRGLEFGNLIPGDTIRQNMHHLSYSTDYLNLFGNIALFVPAGILIRLGLGRGFLMTLLIGFMISLGLETSQLVFSIGTFDVDDMILNTSGGVLGYAMIRAAQALDKNLMPKDPPQEKQASAAPRLL
ncbi:VanZ family protein [Cohnella sp. AR92]|uniref:VanZ family protein n=1 Tax=Cohnella sp. AR92 TaxID=648716 RepID=UPI000F8DAA83|nr:VanZ family protein [Cohnella sp. AR92]RUS47945.1 VanZ family protein [Cohnella sp. AR92]